MATVATERQELSAPLLTPALLPLLREIGNLKRIHSAGRDGSIAARLFRTGWQRLLGGASLQDVGLATAAEAVAATGLGDLDPSKLTELGLTEVETRDVLRSAVANASEPLPLRLREQLLERIGSPGEAGTVPAFVSALERQPRAGVTCPGRGRLMFQPAESHAEHCAVVAVYAVLIAPTFGADMGQAFLSGIAHHLHNAAMPDSGFAGEVLLGTQLDAVIARARTAVLDDLPSQLRAQIVATLDLIADDREPPAKAFHAADAIDRVLEIEQHVHLAKVSMPAVLDDYELVHAGPVKAFQDRVLQGVGLT